MVSAIDRMTFGKMFQLLPRHTRAYQAITVRPKYAKIEQDAIRNSVSINRLTIGTTEGRSKLDITAGSTVNKNPNTVKVTSTEE